LVVPKHLSYGNGKNMIVSKDGFAFDIAESFVKDMRQYLKRKVRAIPHKLTDLTISEHAQQKRIMPAGTPRPGPWDNDYTPYLVEIMNEVSPFSTTACLAAWRRTRLV